ncbi:MAG: hypothetical protein ACREUC_10130 [Steroidobacteraceae bacterium]
MTSLDKVEAAAGSAFILLALVVQPARAAEYRAPRNEYGQPDLRGVWNFSSDVPLERAKELADKNYRTREELDKANAARDTNLERLTQVAGGVGAHNSFWLDYKAHAEDLRTSLISHPANGRLPKLVDGVQKIGGFAAALKDIPGTRPVRFYFGGIGKDGPEDRGLGERCVASEVGPPLIPGFDNNYIQIFQGRDHVVILNEQIHDARTIPLDTRPPLDDELRAWLGYSRGRWDADTLVVETTNFNDLTPSFDNSGTAYHKTVTERFTRVSDTTVSYAVTLVDPKTFQDRIEFSFPMIKTDHRIHEFACHEGNYSMDMILRGARKEERDALQTKKQ